MLRTVAVLIVAALLEAGGNALVRLGLQRDGWPLGAGAIILVGYGIVVNQGRLDFGRLMGCYIAAFFVISQVLAAVVFQQIPSTRTLVGGALIVAGGVTIIS